jgi:hypothetical protein
MSYQPSPVPVGSKIDDPLREYLNREFRLVASALRDDSKTVFYRTSYESEHSLSAGDSANYKIGSFASNVFRISTSNTLTISGIADRVGMRERVLINVGTGVLYLKSEGTESSASFRFALPTHWQLSANASATLWYDPVSSRHRGISRT